MFGLFFGPIGWAATAVVAVAAYALKDDEKSSSGTHDTDSKHSEEKNNIINKEIESYKENQKNRFKNNYKVDIKFVSRIEKNNYYGIYNTITLGEQIYGIDNNKNKVIIQGIDSKFESIANLENEIIELEDLVMLLKSEKTEVINESI